VVENQKGYAREGWIMELGSFWSALWRDYATIAPTAASIKRDLLDAGERVVDDHVAFRTFDRGPLSVDALEALIVSVGYVRDGTYFFERKKLRAHSYLHARDATAPKIFLSGLLLERCSPAVQECVSGLVRQIPKSFARDMEALWSGIPWRPISIQDYVMLRQESEYAAWLAALGFHANHFTVLVNALSDELASVAKILDWVEARGFRINSSGGRVKGGVEAGLEQGSTMADEMTVSFSDGQQMIPTCYYEFAQRFVVSDGALYQGFVTASADKIFESTDGTDHR
jgi:hypothetical protein